MTNDRGRCWVCGYRLDGISSHQCPECGKEFDPHDAATMKMTGAVNRVSRWLITRPLGILAVVLAAVATGMILATTRWPVGALDFSFVDVRYLMAPGKWLTFWWNAVRQTWTDLLLVGGMELWGVLLAVVLVRAGLRWYLGRQYGPVPSP